MRTDDHGPALRLWILGDDDDGFTCSFGSHELSVRVLSEPCRFGTSVDVIAVISGVCGWFIRLQDGDSCGVCMRIVLFCEGLAISCV